LQNDPDEMKNLYSQHEHANRVRELKVKLTELRRESGDIDPPGPVPFAGPCHR